MIRQFRGICDVCGDPIEFVYDDEQTGCIDFGIADDGHIYTWIRHYATAPAGADPDCARYFSTVHEVNNLHITCDQVQ